MKNEWINGVKPPNEMWVEVIRGNGEVTIAMAVYGRDGTLPHWQTKDGFHCHPGQFSRWRPITTEQSDES